MARHDDDSKAAVTLTQSDLARRIGQTLELDPALCETIIMRMAEEIGAALEDKVAVRIQSFGTFAIRSIPAWNIQPPSQRKVTLPEKNVPFFRSDSALRRRVNDGFDWHPRDQKRNIH